MILVSAISTAFTFALPNNPTNNGYTSEISIGTYGTCENPPQPCPIEISEY